MLKNRGFQKGHPQFNSGRTHFKKGNVPPFKGKKGIHLSEKTEFKKGQKPWNVGIDPMSKEQRLAWVEKMKGRTAWNKGKKGEYGTSKKGKKQPQVSGENHWAWQGGITPKNRAIRNSLETKVWRKAVFERDRYICQECGQIGGELHADHIKQFAYYPDLRFVVTNGRTLCKECHRKTPTYAKRVLC